MCTCVCVCVCVFVACLCECVPVVTPVTSTVPYLPANESTHCTTYFFFNSQILPPSGRASRYSAGYSSHIILLSIAVRRCWMRNRDRPLLFYLSIDCASNGLSCLPCHLQPPLTAPAHSPTIYLSNSLSALLFSLRLVFASLAWSVTLTSVCLVELSLCLHMWNSTHTHIHTDRASERNRSRHCWESRWAFCKWPAAAKSLTLMTLTVRVLISYTQPSFTHLVKVNTPAVVIRSS